MTETDVRITERNGKRVLIPDATMLADAIGELPPGQTSDLAGVRRSMARLHGSDLCCPVTVQRHLVAFSQSGDVPYWRVVNPGKPFAKRLQGGGERIREMLAAESTS